MLLYGLQPGQQFQHKLGMGKAIGLGSVLIEPAAICLVSRRSRYQAAGFRQQRYQDRWVSPNLLEEWRLVYPDEAPEAAPGVQIDVYQNCLNAFSKKFPKSRLMTQGATFGRALLWLGALRRGPNAPPVHWPTLVGQAPGSEAFKWFVINDTRKGEVNAQRKFLPSLGQPGTPDVALPENPGGWD